MNRRPNQYYVDPIDLWAERHPVIAAAALGIFVYAFVFLMCLL